MKRIVTWCRANIGRLNLWYRYKRGFLRKLLWLPFLLGLHAGNLTLGAVALVLIGPVGLIPWLTAHLLTRLEGGVRFRFRGARFFGRLLWGPILLMLLISLKAIFVADLLIGFKDTLAMIDNLR